MVLQHARSSFHFPWDKVEASRIAATAGAIALNIGLLMLLLIPATRMAMPQLADDGPTTWVLPPEKVDPPKPPPPKPVPVTPQQHTAPAPTPVTPRPAIDAQPTEIIDPTGTLPPVDPTPTIPAPPTTLPPAGPMVGAHLEYLDAPRPRYTRELLAMGAEGSVLLQVLVGIDGKPIEIKVLKSSGIRKLDELAQRTVSKWTFKPAMQDGRPVQAIGNVPIDFSLQ